MDSETATELRQALAQAAQDAGLGWVVADASQAIREGIEIPLRLRRKVEKGNPIYTEVYLDSAESRQTEGQDFYTARRLDESEALLLLVESISRAIADIPLYAGAAVKELRAVGSYTQITNVVFDSEFDATELSVLDLAELASRPAATELIDLLERLRAELS